MYGGAAGGGKSDALLIDAIGQADKKRYKAVIFRRSYPELEELILRSLELYPAIIPGAKYKDSKKRWEFPSGAKLYFRYIEKDKDALRYQGQSFAYIGWDELTHFSEFAYKYLFSRCRSTDKTIKCYIRATTNPGGPGHNWVKQRFIDAAEPMTPVYDEKAKSYRVFIPAKLSDNPPLDETEYGQRLETLPDADRKALKDGDWDAYVGKVFKLVPGIHTWTWAQFKERTGLDRPHADWNRFRTMDWGFAHPFANYWYAVDYDGRAYVYREWYGVAKDANGQIQPNVGVRMEPEKVAVKIAGIEKEAGETKVTGWTGPDLGQPVRGDHAGPTVVAAGGGMTIQSHFTKHGVYWQFWTATAGSRLAGKLALHQRMAYPKDDEGNPLDWPGIIFICDPDDPTTCHHAVRTLPLLEYDEHQPELVDTDGEDHAFDSIAGFCKMKPWAPVKKVVKKPSWMDRQNRQSGMIV